MHAVDTRHERNETVRQPGRFIGPRRRVKNLIGLPQDVSGRGRRFDYPSPL